MTLKKDDPAIDENAGEKTEIAKLLKAQEKVAIMVHKSDSDQKSTHISVGVNGFFYQIERGKKVNVPMAVLEVLKNAITTRYSQITDKDNKIHIVPNDMQAYPFSLA